MNEKHIKSIKERIAALEGESIASNDRIDQLEQRLRATSKLLSSQLRFAKDERDNIQNEISKIDRSTTQKLNEKTTTSDVIAIVKLYHEGKLPFEPHSKL